MEGCWRALFFDSQRRDARLFTCVRAWRCAVLRRKHRFHVATAREWRQVHFFEVLLACLREGSIAMSVSLLM